MLLRLLALLAIVFPGIFTARAQEAGRLIVTVTEAETGKPVAGAIIGINVGTLDRRDWRAQVTDAAGRYETSVPFGNLVIRMQSPPVGYWIVGQRQERLLSFDQVAVTRLHPTIERSFELTRGVVWPARAVSRTGKPVEGVRLRASANSFNRGHGGTSQTDAGGNCFLTIPRGGGDLWVSCSHDKQLIRFASSRVQLEIDPEFDHTQVVSQSPAKDGDRIVLVDRQGRRASLAGCRAALEDGEAQLLFEVQDPPGQEFAGEVVGRVVDEENNPIAGATVMCLHDTITAEAQTQQTDEQGGFRFRSLFKWSAPGKQPAFGLWISKDGFGRREVAHFYTPGMDGMFRLEPLALVHAYSLPVRVLGADGRPVEGAWIISASSEYLGNKSDRDGLCILPNLPAGPHTIGVQYGDEQGSAKVEVTPESPRAAPLIIRLQKRTGDLVAPALTPRVTPLKPGDKAPEWSVAQWIDDREHSLAELRGRVVVIEFWDLSCGPCIEVSLPVSHMLAKKFKDVAFIHINPASAQRHLVKELLQLKGWSFLVGFDNPERDAGGRTLKHYAVQGYSTIVVLDRSGRVVDNTGDHGTIEQEEAKAKEIAAAGGLPWPLDKDASREEVVRRLQRFHELRLTMAIEQALATK